MREQGLLTETILLGNQADKLAHENITEVLDPLSAEMREYLRDLVQESGSVAQVFAAHIDQLLHVPGQEIGGHDDRLDQVSNVSYTSRPLLFGQQIADLFRLSRNWVYSNMTRWSHGIGCRSLPTLSSLSVPTMRQPRRFA